MKSTWDASGIVRFPLRLSAVVGLDPTRLISHIGAAKKGKAMRAFLETAFGPIELETIDEVFQNWLDAHRVLKGSPDAELAAAIIITLYREGHDTRSALETAMSKHRGLSDLAN